jgi:shikimate kinase
MKNIVLVGFMGTGKTKVARALSESLDMEYISTDDLIEKKEEMRIPDIFAKKGEGYFRKIEKEVVSVVSNMEKVVIDTGGGVVIDAENVRLLKEKGIIICLWAEPEVILDRTKKYTHRPLLAVSDPLAKIKALLESRKRFYERADHHVHTSSMPFTEAVREIEKIAKENG